MTGMNRRALAFLLVPLLIACGDDEVEGTYELESVDGDFLPVVVSAFGETDWWISDGRLVVREDSVRFNETFEDPEGDAGLSFGNWNDYSVDGNTFRSLPEAPVDPNPDDEFTFCDVGGVYRVEDDGDVLRLVEVLTDGDCEDLDLAYHQLERVYRRD